jgi:SAM-dependent methyltransferase
VLCFVSSGQPNRSRVEPARPAASADRSKAGLQRASSTVETTASSFADELRSGYSAPGFAARYNLNRPRPPSILLELLPLVANVDRPALVVDLGSGTGLSTRFWAETADCVVGVEPNPEMRRYAETVTSDANVRYVGGRAEATGLSDAAADVVTCAQSLQWMEPRPTFEEIDRILRDGGVFAAYNYRSLVTGSWELDRKFDEVRAAAGRLRHELGLDAGKRRWPVSREQLEASGRFRFTNEMSVHSIELGNAERLIGFLLSEGSVSTLLEHVPEEAIGLHRLRTIAATALTDHQASWYIGYGVWFGVK